MGSALGDAVGSPDGDGSGELKGVDSGDGDGEGDGVADGVCEGVCCGEGLCCGEAKDSWRLKEVAGANETKIARHNNKIGKTLMLILKRIFPMKNEL